MAIFFLSVPAYDPLPKGRNRDLLVLTTTYFPYFIQLQVSNGSPSYPPSPPPKDLLQGYGCSGCEKGVGMGVPWHQRTEEGCEPQMQQEDTEAQVLGRTAQ